MRGKKNKNSWVMGMANESTYQVNGVTYIVASQFETRSEDLHTLRSRFERQLQSTSTLGSVKGKKEGRSLVRVPSP